MVFKLTNTQKSQLLDAIKAGSDLITAAHYAKIDIDELIAFMEFAESEKKTAKQKEAAELLVEIKAAKASAIINAQARLTGSMAGDWKAAAWWLERTLPEIYSQKKAEQ